MVGETGVGVGSGVGRVPAAFCSVGLSTVLSAFFGSRGLAAGFTGTD